MHLTVEFCMRRNCGVFLFVCGLALHYRCDSRQNLFNFKFIYKSSLKQDENPMAGHEQKALTSLSNKLPSDPLWVNSCGCSDFSSFGSMLMCEYSGSDAVSCCDRHGIQVHHMQYITEPRSTWRTQIIQLSIWQTIKKRMAF